MNYKHGATVLGNRTSSNPQWKAHYCWIAMRGRCEIPSSKDYPGWGGRGITVCPEWHDFDAFYRDMGPPPEGTTLDRIDNDGNYEPGNCRWADRKTQSTNRRNRREITHNGETRSLTEWAEHLGVPRRLLQVRMDRGWSAERMLKAGLEPSGFQKGHKPVRR